MHITIEKTTTEEIEVKPGYYKDDLGTLYCITKTGVMVRINTSYAILIYKPGDYSYDKSIAKAMEGVIIPGIEFIKQFNLLQTQFNTILNED